MIALPLMPARPADEAMQPIRVSGGVIEVELSSDSATPTAADLTWWIRAAADAVTRYYGRFPVAQVRLEIDRTDGGGVRHGNTFGRDGYARIRISVGSDAGLNEFRTDWVLPHEMVHLAFPNVADQHHWIEEGIATYVEPMARMQAGYLKPEKVWGDLFRDLRQGLPRPGDQGLDHTNNWATTYWGGALFCFLADVKIRQQTHNAKGLQDALRGILAAGGDIGKDWELERALRAGDAATGTQVMEELYAEMKDQPLKIDLDGVWKQLGVEGQNGATAFDEQAPLAAVRRSITAGKQR